MTQPEDIAETDAPESGPARVRAPLDRSATMVAPPDAGFLAGNRIRKARKAFFCNGWQFKAKTHKRIVAPGEYYVEGDVDIDVAGGFGHLRYCEDCAPFLRQWNHGGAP